MEAEVEPLLFSPLCNILFSHVAVTCILFTGQAWRAWENGRGSQPLPESMRNTLRGAVCFGCTYHSDTF